MKKEQGNIYSVAIIVLIIIVIVIGVFWWIGNYVFNYQNDLFLGVMAGLTPSLITIFLNSKNQQREHKNWILRNKEAFLIEIIDILISQFHEKKSQEHLVKRIKNIQPALMAHGSSDALELWSDFTTPLMDSTNDAYVQKRIERFLRTIRKDLGHDDSKIAPGGVTATFLSTKKEKDDFLKVCKNEKY